MWQEADGRARGSPGLVGGIESAPDLPRVDRGQAGPSRKVACVGRAVRRTVPAGQLGQGLRSGSPLRSGLAGDPGRLMALVGSEAQAPAQGRVANEMDAALPAG